MAPAVTVATVTLFLKRYISEKNPLESYAWQTINICSGLGFVGEIVQYYKLIFYPRINCYGSLWASTSIRDSNPWSPSAESEGFINSARALVSRRVNMCQLIRQTSRITLASFWKRFMHKFLCHLTHHGSLTEYFLFNDSESLTSMRTEFHFEISNIFILK